MGPPRRLAAISGHVVVAPSAASGAIRRAVARLARGLADALDSAPDEALPADDQRGPEVAAAGASSSERANASSSASPSCRTRDANAGRSESCESKGSEQSSSRRRFYTAARPPRRRAPPRCS